MNAAQSHALRRGSWPGAQAQPTSSGPARLDQLQLAWRRAPEGEGPRWHHGDGHTVVDAAVARLVERVAAEPHGPETLLAQRPARAVEIADAEATLEGGWGRESPGRGRESYCVRLHVS